jgi:phenylacetate-CoA ligase
MELLSGSDLRCLQIERLKTLVERLQAKVPFYKGHLKGIAPEKLKSLADLRQLPFTNKADLRSNYPFGLLAVNPEELVRIHASSGTKGRPNVAGYTKNDLSLWAEVCARSLAAAGVKPGDVLQNSYHYGLFTGGLGIHYGAELLGAVIVPASSGRTQLQVSLMQDFGTKVLCCTPSYALTIAYMMEELGVASDSLKLKIGVFGAEPWSEELRQQLQSRLGIQALDIYGLTEVIGPGVSMECSHSGRNNGGLHVWEDHFLPEIIDPKTGEILPDGQEGELVFTSLTREALPYLRYRTSDICHLSREPCGCGRTMVRMSRVKARIDDMLIIRGVNVYPSEIERILLQIEELSPHYRLVVDRLKTLDSLLVEVEVTERIVKSWGDINDDNHQVKELAWQVGVRLKDSLGVMAEVVLLKPRSLARSEGKAVRVIDKRTKAKEEIDNGKTHGTL